MAAALFGKHDSGNTVQQILQMRQGGMDDDSIMDGLRSQGVPTQQIFDAMSQADLSGYVRQPGDPAGAEGDSGDQNYPPNGGYQYEQAYPGQQAGPGDERIHEIAEAIINEKWEEILREMRKVVDWKEKADAKMQHFSDEIAALKDDFGQLRQGILGKINESDMHMRDVSSELKAMHNVFKDVVPSFTENVAELSRLTEKLKGKKS